MIRILPVLLSLSVSAQSQIKYQEPEKLISELVSSPGFSYPYFNPQFTEFIKYRTQTTPSIEYTNRPFLRLAGVRFNPLNLAPVSGSYRVDLRYYDQKTKKDKSIAFSPTSYVRTFSWSPNGKKLAVQVESPRCVELWLVSIPSLKKQKVPDVCLSTALGSQGNYYWLDDESILVSRRIANKEIKVSLAVPQGPVVQESLGKIAQNRTYQDLLKTPQEAEAFAEAIKSKITVIGLKSFSKKDLGPADYYLVAEPSPNNKWLMVARLERPFSYVVPFYYFKRERFLLSIDGKHKKTLGQVGPFESLPIQGVTTGPRELEWDTSHPQRFFYAEAQDGGDWKNKVPFRDFIYLATIESSKGDIKTQKIAELENRYAGMTVLEDPKQGFFVLDYERDSKELRYFQLKPQEGHFTLKEFLRRNANDDYTDPGSVISGRNQFNRSVGRVQKTKEGDFIYWSGRGATPEGERPFLAKMNLADMKSSEVFRSAQDKYENIWYLFPNEFSRFLLRRESPSEAPWLEIRTLEKPAAPGKILFEEENPFKVMGQLKKKLLKYKRKDGIEMTGILYYPLDYQEGKKYPAVVSAYPLEYTDAKSASQTRGSASHFETPFRATPVYFALRGYFVLDEAQIPIVGHPETKNDTFIEQLVWNAEATVKALEGTGAIDAKRVGVVGHSYGAFMVAHLLTHTKSFASGIARSGAYNRTLTPFGFQGERRTLWEAKSTYLKLSPFLDADKMKYPLLMFHGMEDNNPGTFTLQSERYYEALKGQGAITRLVLLPTEGHGYNAEESVKHVLWESFQWFDKYLKN